MNDLISRQNAVNAIIGDKICDGLPVIYNSQQRDFEVFNSACDRHAKILNELPSAQKTGKWTKETKYHKDQFQEFNYYIIRCSVCGNRPEKAWHLTPFCPNCGAKMVGEEE